MTIRTSGIVASVALILAGCAALPGQEAAYHTAQCKTISEAEITALFERWNDALQTGEPAQVVALYADDAILLPTMSNTPRLTAAERADYFDHFLADGPSGSIDLRQIEIGCNTAVDAGLYTFDFADTGASVSGRYSYTYRWDGETWLITSHHSSVMPE